ncbi:MAG: lipopolysaccharide export system protein LptA [Alphaproteobacteria bacterium]|jgi:lipopolysaccharide export system protein LptA|nr:lipopolysaccharide export system protein LptA [Alphaproteobacteria bacterium]
MNRRPAQRGRVLLGAVALALAVLAPVQAVAQQNRIPPSTMQGLSSNRDQPVRIQSASLEVRDKQQLAIFSGDVHVVQGDTDMKCKILHVYYDNNASGEAAKGGVKKAAQPGPANQQQIRRMEAKGGVILTQKDQVATGDSGEFDMRANTVTLIGNVVMTKGHDVVRGQKVTVDLTTGVYKVDSGGGRVEMLVQPNQQPNQQPDPNAAPGQGPSPRPASRKN